MSKAKTSQIPRWALNQFVPIIVERVQEIKRREQCQQQNTPSPLTS